MARVGPLLMGPLGEQPVELVRPGRRLAGRFAQPQTSAALVAVGIASPAALIATWLTDQDGLARFADDAPRGNRRSAPYRICDLASPGRVQPHLRTPAAVSHRPTAQGRRSSFQRGARNRARAARYVL